MPKVVVIGGGSSYTPELIEGFIQRRLQFPLQQLWLVDVEEGQNKQQTIAQLAQRMFNKAGMECQVYVTVQRQQALADADFVITQFRIGQIEARILDESIPAKHGLIGQETVGAGGMLKGLRTIPEIFAIISDCQQLCPQAWIINFANPSGMITEAVFRYTSWRKFIGLCNVPINMEKSIAQMLDVEHSRVRIDFAGLNHMVFGLDILVDGNSVKDTLLEKLEQQGMSMQNILDNPWSGNFLQGLGAIPCPYHRYYFQKEDMLAHTLAEYNQGRTRGQQVKQLETELFASYDDPALDSKPPELAERGGAYYSDAACSLITSLFNDTGDVQVVNTLNRGAIADLPDDVVVEVSSMIGKGGPRPLTMGNLPPACCGLVQQVKAFELIACRAAVTGSYQDALTALVVNPLVQDEGKAVAVLNEMLLAHGRYLPQFQQTIERLEGKCV